MRATMVFCFLLTCCAANAQDQTGTIVFYREPHFATGDFKPALYCDGVELAQIENGTYFQVTAPAGQHKCTVETSEPSMIEVRVIQRKAAYVHVELKPGFRNHAVLANTTEDEYNKRSTKLKPLKEWSRTALGVAQSQESTDSTGTQVNGEVKNKHSGKFGDLVVNVSKLVLTPSHYSQNRAQLEAFFSVANTGKGVICAEFNVTVKTSFGLQYRNRGDWRAPKMKEMLPGETAEGSYIFDIKDGVQPLELVVGLASRRYDGGSSVGTIRCGSDFPIRDVLVPDEIRLNVRDLPIASGL